MTDDDLDVLLSILRDDGQIFPEDDRHLDSLIQRIQIECKDIFVSSKSNVQASPASEREEAGLTIQRHPRRSRFD